MKQGKLIYLFLAMLVIGVLTACGGNEKKEKTEEGTYTITTVRWSDWGDDFTKGFLEESEEAAGIKINWDYQVSADWGDRKSVLMASGDLPDAFIGSNAFTDSEISQNRALFIPLEELIKEHMPNLTAAMEKDPTLRAIATSPDGHIYGLPKKSPMRPTIANQLFINQTWLDNLGLDMPDTYEDFIDVLVAFKEQDANGNGDTNDEIPYGAGNLDAIFGFILPFDNRLGADNTGDMSVKDGKPVYLRIEESYKEGIAWMHDAYAKGLIDSEIFTQDDSMASAKRMDENISRVGVAGGWTADATFGLHADEYVPIKPLKGPDGERYVLSDPEHYNYARNELLITHQCEDPVALLKWADQLYTDDASIQTFYGSFDIAVEKDGDNYKVLPPGDGKSADEFAWIHSLRDFGPKYVDDHFNERVEIDDSQGDGLKLKLDAEINQYAKPAFPNVTYTAEELERQASIGVDIGSYVGQMASKWIVDGGVEDEWDEYIAQLEAMGLNEYLEIQRTAFDRYNESLSK